MTSSVIGHGSNFTILSKYTRVEESTYLIRPFIGSQDCKNGASQTANS